MTTTETVLYERQDNLALITLNRPERRNALSPQLNQDLLTTLRQARDDDQVRAVVVTGAGSGFCAGADLSVFSTIPTPDQVYDAILAAYQPMMDLLITMPKPIIAAVNGTAAGAGASLALACDLRIMADDASLMMAFSNIGLVPDAGATWLLMRHVGYGRAYQLAIEGEKLSAEACRDMGLANKIVPAADLMTRALEWGHKLSQRPTLALGLTKLAFDYSARHNLLATIEYEARLQRQTIPSHDHMEGVMSFIQKRPPHFQGK